MSSVISIFSLQVIFFFLFPGIQACNTCHLWFLAVHEEYCCVPKSITYDFEAKGRAMWSRTGMVLPSWKCEGWILLGSLWSDLRHVWMHLRQHFAGGTSYYCQVSCNSCGPVLWVKWGHSVDKWACELSLNLSTIPVSQGFGSTLWLLEGRF